MACMGCKCSVACKTELTDRGEAGEFSNLQYMEGTTPLDNVYELLGCYVFDGV